MVLSPPDGLSSWDGAEGIAPGDGCQCLNPFCTANGLLALLVGLARPGPDCGPRSLEGALWVCSLCHTPQHHCDQTQPRSQADAPLPAPEAPSPNLAPLTALRTRVAFRTAASAPSRKEGVTGSHASVRCRWLELSLSGFSKTMTYKVRV